MKDWYERSMKALQLAGLAERTQYSYTRDVRLLVEFCGKTPDLIFEQDLEEYFLNRRNVAKWSAGTLRVCYRFCSERGTSSATCAPSVPRSYPPSCPKRRSRASSPACKLPTTGPS
jgi:hypothetical protein